LHSAGDDQNVAAVALMMMIIMMVIIMMFLFHLFPLSRSDPGRYCSECDCYHPVSEGDTWYHSQSLFQSLFQGVRLYTAHSGIIWDMTDYGKCNVSRPVLLLGGMAVWV
jgi:hypothetical protein